MAAIVGALRAVLSLESAAFTRGLSQAQKSMTGFEKRMSRWGSNLQKAGAAISVVGAGIALTMRRQIQAADDMGKAAQKFGIPVETLSKLAYAGELADVSIDTLGTSTRALSRLMNEAAKGGKSATAVFDNIGVAAVDATGALRPTEDVIADVASVMARMPDGAEKTALAMKLFGRSGSEMIPLLNAGGDGLREMMAEAQKFGLVIDERTAKAAENFNDSLTRVGGALRGLTVQIMSAAAPAMEWLSEKAVALASNPLAAKIGAITLALGPLLIALGIAATSLGKVVLVVRVLTATLLANPIILVITAIAAGAVLIYQNWEPIKAFFVDTWNAIGGAAAAAWEKVKGWAVGAAGLISGAWAGVKSFFSGIWAGVQNAAMAAWDSVKSNATGAANFVRDGFRGAVDYIGQMFNRIPEMLKAVWQSVKAEFQSWVDGFRNLGRDLLNGLSFGIGQEEAAVSARMQAAMLSVEVAARAAAQTHSPSKVFAKIGGDLMAGLGGGISTGAPGVQAEMGGVIEGVAEEAASLSTGMQSLQSTFLSATESMVLGTMGLKGALKSVLDQIAQIAAQNVAAGLFGGPEGGGLLGGLLGGLGKILPFAKGGVLAAGRVQAFADGGIVNRATAFGMASGGLGIMGEAGPEAIMPLTRGPGGKLGVAAKGGGGTVRIELGEGLIGHVLQEAHRGAVQVVQANNKMLPEMVGAISRDPRRR